MEHIEGYALKITTDLEYDRAIEVVTEKLMEKGFGILTEIDVSQTLKTKIDVDFKPYRILGACNPPLANRSLNENNIIGVFLPCNIVVWDDGDQRTVAAMNPEMIGQSLENPEIKSITEEVYNKIVSVLTDIEQIS